MRYIFEYSSRPNIANISETIYTVSAFTIKKNWLGKEVKGDHIDLYISARGFDETERRLIYNLRELETIDSTPADPADRIVDIWD